MSTIRFFEEAPGVSSMTRLLLFITVMNAIAMSDLVLAIGLYTDQTKNIGTLVGSVVALFAGLTSIMATLKILQKPHENERTNRESGEIPEATSGGTGEQA